MTQRTLNLIKGIATGIEAIAVAVVTYTCDSGIATAVNSAIIIGINAIVEICGKFVKE